MLSRTKYYLILLSVQIVVAIIVYFSLSTVPTETEETHCEPEETYEQANWTYEENGPKEWVSIDPTYYACGGGYEQSPINIQRESIWEDKTFDLELNYSPTKFLLENTGHTIEVKDTSGKNTLMVDGEEYILKQIHFHLPSEHQLNGKTFNMEGHLVHQAENGKIAVVGLFIKEGQVNTDLAEMWSLLPYEETTEPIELSQSIDLLEVVPKEKDVYLYSGSLTTPPCTEGVTWLLMEEPVEMSSQQIEVYAELYANTNRPIQPLNDRKIYKNDME
ncbi:Carbonic anhydrase OS=Ureibacillus acetophenoni OX=614649 GN=SAMN05877842_10217 PE=3 SV=1 [Ureibacillus acetophenoni]